MQKGDEASLSIILARQALLVKMPRTLEPNGVFGSNFEYLLSSHWYEKGDEASPSIILAHQARFMKMLITLEPRGAIGSNFEYLCILTSFSHWHAKR